MSFNPFSTKVLSSTPSFNTTTTCYLIENRNNNSTYYSCSDGNNYTNNISTNIPNSIFITNAGNTPYFNIDIAGTLLNCSNSDITPLNIYKSSNIIANSLLNACGNGITSNSNNIINAIPNKHHHHH